MVFGRFLKAWLLKSDDQKHQTLERLYWAASFVLSCLITFGAFRSFYFAHQAADAGWEAARQARQQAEAAQAQLIQSKAASRPYVIVQISGDRAASNLLEKNPIKDGSFNFYVVKLRFTNFGTTPAIITHIEGSVSTDLSHDEFNKRSNTEEHATDLVLIQGQSTGEYTWKGTVSQEEEQRLTLDNLQLHIAGKVVYADVFGNLQSTDFCYVMPTHSHDLRMRIVPAYDPGCFNKSS